MHDNLTITHTAATDITGFSSLENVGSTFNISDNPELLSMSSLGSFLRIGNDLLIDSNAKLSNLNGLWAIQFIGGSVYIEENNEITDITLASLSYIGNSSGNNIFNNANLQSINLPQMDIVYGTFTIRSNPLLTTLSSSVVHSDDLIIENNDTLTSISFSSLENVGNIEIYYNDIATVNFSSLESSGTLEIYENDLLTSLNFPALVTIDGRMRIYGHALLEEILFPVLESTYDIYIFDNETLVTFDHPSLTTIYDQDCSQVVNIQNNPLLVVTFNYSTAGNCSDGTYTDQNSCEAEGVCSDATHNTQADCETASETWTAETWTPVLNNTSCSIIIQ